MSADKNLPDPTFKRPLSPLPDWLLTALASIDIHHIDSLQETGAVQAYLQLRAGGHSVTLQVLYTLEAAIRGGQLSQLSAEDRNVLQQALKDHPPVRLPPPAVQAEYFMDMALCQADLAEKEGEVPIGAVVVYQKKIIATGYNQPISQHNPSAHAEISAISAAAKSLRNYRLIGCDLYVTLEPCTMCAGAIIQSRLDRVIFGAKEYKSGAAGSIINLFANRLLNSHTAVFGGIREEVCRQKLQTFFKLRRNR